MLSKSYREKWRRHFHKNRTGYIEILNDDSLMEGGLSQAKLDLSFGLQLLNASEEDDLGLGACFLRRGRLILSNTLPHLCIHWDDMFVPTDDIEWCEIYTRAEFRRTQVYLDALLGGKFHADSLVRASADLVKWTLSMAAIDPWDSKMQADYLSSIRMVLIAGDVKGAQRLFEVDFPFDDHPEEYQLLKLVSAGGRSKRLDNNYLLDLVDNYFDWIRDPDLRPTSHMNREMVRFEMGVLRYKILMSPDDSFNWTRIIDIISQ